MRSPVILLGQGRVTLAEDALVEPRGGGLAALEDLLATSPRAAVVTSGGEGGFYRASLCLERGIGRVVLGRGILPPAWEAELAARGKIFGAELFVHDDVRGYARVKPGPRVAVGVPDPLAWSEGRAATRGLVAGPEERAAFAEVAPLERDVDAFGSSVHLEEIAFENGDKPVLYLVVPEREVDAVRARHAGATVVVAREAPSQVAVEGATGRRLYGGAAGERSAHVFVSRNPELAARAAKLWEEGSSKNAGAIGELMGYPRCCAQAFVALAERGNNAALVYVTDGRTRALGGTHHFVLNVAVRRLVPFTPCTFGCVRAVPWAERVLSRLPRTVAEPLARSLSRPVLYFDEARAIAFAGAKKTSNGLSFESAFFLAPAAPLAPDDEMEARRLFGWLCEGGGELVITADAFEVRGKTQTKRLSRKTPRLGVLLPFGLD